MKKKVIKVLSLLFIATVVLSSCSKDSSTPPVDPRTQYDGIYNVAENWSCQVGTTSYNGTDDYNITLSSSVNAGVILISNIENLSNITLNVNLSGSTFTIPSQSITIGIYSVIFSGNGTFTSKGITMNYVANNFPVYDVNDNFLGLTALTAAYTGNKQ
jgi:hypothetical protein